LYSIVVVSDDVNDSLVNFDSVNFLLIFCLIGNLSLWSF